jgi:hypothetical protein
MKDRSINELHLLGCGFTVIAARRWTRALWQYEHFLFPPVTKQ